MQQSELAPHGLHPKLLPGNLPHIGIVSDSMNGTENKPLIIHNIGGGAARDDVLGFYPITGRYRYLLAS